jgi:AraC family transcriptional regulator
MSATSRASAVEPFRRKRAWESLRVEHARAPSCSYVDLQYAEHEIVLLLGSSMYGRLASASGMTHEGPASAGKGYIFPANRRHSVEGEGDVEWLSIWIDPSIVERAAHEARASRVAIRESWVDRDPTIWQVGMTLRDEIEVGGPADRLLAESLANVLAVHLVRRYAEEPAETAPIAGGLTGRRLRHAVEFIRDRLGESISLDEIAATAGLSTFHFAREFKRTTGETPYRFVTRERVEMAKRLLRETDLSLVEIALRSGFANQSHFTRNFRKLALTTPGAYRAEGR